MTGLLVVGEMPARTADPTGTPLGPGGGRSGDRLARLLGVGAVQDAARAVNLVETYARAFPAFEAALAAGRLLSEAPEGKWLLLGRNVEWAVAGERARRPWLQPWEWDGRTMITVPHPSGRNRWWNDPVNVESARRVLQRCETLSEDVEP